MTDDYTLLPASLEGDALTFDTWSKELDGYQKGIPTNLVSTDFSDIPHAQEVWAQWESARGALDTYIGQGSDVMDSFARTLLQTVKIYLEAEDFSQSEVDRVVKELDEL
jgi:hypothetical protein